MLYRHRFLLILIMTLAGITLNSCLEEKTPRFRMAFFQCDVTPPVGTPIYSGYEPLETIEHPLLAKGIVLDNEAERFVICAVDWCEICNSTHELFRETLAEAAQTDPSRVAVQTVHQHTAPMGDAGAMRILNGLDNPPPHPDPEVLEAAATRVGKALQKSLSEMRFIDRIGNGKALVENVAATRRVRAEDGTIMVRWSRCTDPKLRAMPEGKIDPFLKTVTLAAGDQPLVRLHYYTTHPQSFYGDPRASYDFPGIARQRLEEEEGVFQIYFTGCAGDVTAGKYNDGSPEAREQLGARLYQGMKASIASTSYESIEDVVWNSFPVTLPLPKDKDLLLEQYQEKIEDPELVHSARVGAAMSIATFQRNEDPYILSTLKINNSWLVHLPGECMIDYQFYTQQLRPEGFIAVAAYGDCGPGYVCTEKAFEEGGYEPSASRVAPESEGILREAISSLLSGREP